MKYNIRKVAVLGSGVMGSGIACHLANAGFEVLMLDIVPFDLSDEDKKSPEARNRLVNTSLQKAIKSKPAALFKKEYAKRITTGNFDDDFEKIADADWIIEVIIEKLDIKQKLFERVEKHMKECALVTSNTSSIPIKMLCEGRSDAFSKRFCGTHFFNPPRYMQLLEIIPHTGTDNEVVEFFMDFGDRYLGKRTVLCKDTPAFIANRIGVMSGSRLYELTDKYDFRIEEVDALTGPLIGRPKTATFRLQDLVGLDTGDKVSKFVISSVKDDEYFENLSVSDTPSWLRYLLDQQFLGNKSGQGFYKKTKDEKGNKVYFAFNLKTHEYEEAIKPKLQSVGDTRKIEKMDKRLQTLLEHDAKGGNFLKEYFASLLAYTSNRVPEISDHIYSIDDAMRTGYAWDYGPFEYWDLIGLAKGIEIIESQNLKPASWVYDMQKQGHDAFYKLIDGVMHCYDIKESGYLPMERFQEFIILDNYRHQEPIIKNSECVVHDIGDQVLCLEFRSKSNAIGEGIGNALAEAIDLAENGDWRGVVIGNNAKNFTVGANLMNVGMLAMQKEFEKLNEMVNGFQQLTMRCRYSNIPVIAATQGYVFGGGCELTMHCDASQLVAESYIGLVEVGVGLIPGGGGTKEMALRASDKYFEGDVQMPTLIDHFKPIATASVATSAAEAFDYNLMLDTKDQIVMNTARNIAEARKQVISMSENYVQPIQRSDISVLGRAGLATLYTAINEFRLGEYMSDYDVEIARKVAYVMCGGDLTSTQKVSEQYLLDLEREAFLSLLGNQKTHDRIQYMLMNNKPLRN